MNKPKHKIELLAPARDGEVAFAAIDHGADAIYIGAASHGARSAASNPIDVIAKVCEYAHRFNVKVYATVNTLVYDNEIETVERLIGRLYEIGTDALIVQDLGILKMRIPPIDLHASTQCDIRTPEKARFLADLGFSRIVIPRELSIAETKAISDAVAGTEIEAFVHGALCVSYSGDCQAGFITSGRSANRGECPQLCRLPYDLLDRNGKTLIAGRHLLSLRDLNRSDALAEMIRAGVDSFKIEGRLKDTGYVRNVVAAYRRDIDRILAEDPSLGVRASDGVCDPGFTPDTAESFNRGFTSYFTGGIAAAAEMASIASPKWTGREVARITRHRGNRITVGHGQGTDIANGDGLGYFRPDGTFEGFRVNRVEGDTLITARPVPPAAPGTILLRNRNKRFDDMLEAAHATRLIGIDMTLRLSADAMTLALDLSDSRGLRVTATHRLASAPEKASRPQPDARRRTLAKTGGTIYEVLSVNDLCGDAFIPLSILSDLRRRAIDLLDATQRATYRQRLRLRPKEQRAELPADMRRLSYHHNVANRLAAALLSEAGAEIDSMALEAGGEVPSDAVVMTTRYCLRRELGECLRENSRNRQLPPGDLRLRNGMIEFRVSFDCDRCGMTIRRS